MKPRNFPEDTPKAHFFGSALYQHVVNVNFHDVADVTGEDFVDEPLVCCPRVLQTERHDIIAVQPFVCYECGMFAVGRVHEYLIIAGVGIHKAQQLVAGSGIHELVYPWQREAVLRAGFVEIGIVLAHSPPSCGLSYHDGICQPYRICCLPDEADGLEFFDLLAHRFVPFGIV
ncbi:hypothetical protein L3X38_034055 [Prunus dulcis]|uniref:Uncharacterized protein n=1 Tax=Prunus dulcis TaxID=3755 RepID=A0AAD4YWH3_PRUDU|nr:hypothetical protein L3X38_034055 [Prunus dulcis]